jgi:hypothetical protein
MGLTQPVMGKVVDEQTVTLDEPLPAEQIGARVSVEPVPASSAGRRAAALAAIRERQRRRGYQPLPPAEVETDLHAERNSWEE